MLMYKNKRAQTAETMTWVVATIIIIVLLIAFIYISSLIAGAKGIERFAKSIKINDKTVSVDWVEEKSEIALDKNNQNENQVRNWVKT